MSDSAQTESISVVIAAYNSGAWIREAIESALAQTRVPEEIVVVDDGSTDDTAGVAASFGPPVRLIREEHTGRPHRNRGIATAVGSLIAFLDADDIWNPAKLEKQVSALQRTGAAWAISDAQWFDSAHGTLVSVPGMRAEEGDVLSRLFLHNFIVASTPLVLRSVFDEVGVFDESAAVAPVEDWDLWLRIAARYPVARVGEPMARIRLHSDSFLASTPLSARVRSLENVVNRSVERERDRLGPLKAQALYNLYYAAGVSLYRAKHKAEARGYFLTAWRQLPFSLGALGYIVAIAIGDRAIAPLVREKRRRTP